MEPTTMAKPKKKPHYKLDHNGWLRAMNGVTMGRFKDGAFTPYRDHKANRRRRYQEKSFERLINRLWSHHHASSQDA
jgi:hypothetical protein